MRQKVNKDASQNQNLACFQSNFRMVIKSLLEIEKVAQTRFYYQIMTSVGIEYQTFVDDTQAAKNSPTLKHVIINELEKFIWMDSD